jgi:hypothetical protein
MRAKGWFGESYRHALSSKGVQTRRMRQLRGKRKVQDSFIKTELFKYRAEKEEKKKNAFEKLMAPPEGQAAMQERTANEQIMRAESEIMKARDTGRINDQAANEIRNGVEEAAKRYKFSINETQGSETFKQDVQRELDKIDRYDSSRLKVMDFGQEKKEKSFPTIL